MKALYISLILFVGCRENSFRYLKFNQKGKISPLMDYLIEDRNTLNNFIEELELDEEYKRKLVYILESKEEFKLNGSDVLYKASKDNDCNVIEAYYKYQKGIFDIRPIKYRKLVLELIKIAVENRSLNCFEFLISTIKDNSQAEYLDTNEIFSTILENDTKNTYRYIDLRKEYSAIKETKKTAISIIIDPKPVINFNILTSVGLGIGYIGMGISKNFENISTRSLLILGGTILFATPIYNYWKKFTKYKKEIIIKQESINYITAKLNSKKSKLLEIKDKTEESELSMIDYLMDNININLDKHMIEKFESVEKKKISAYLKNRLN